MFVLDLTDLGKRVFGNPVCSARPFSELVCVNITELPWLVLINVICGYIGIFKETESNWSQIVSKLPDIYKRYQGSERHCCSDLADLQQRC